MIVDKTEETIKEIAVKHGIAIGRDDPILILQTMNDRLIQESIAAQKDSLNTFKNALEEISYQWGEDAKNKAERTLNAALAASKEAMSMAVKENANITAALVKKEVEKVLIQQLKPSIQMARRVSWMNLICSGMVVFAVGLTVWVVW